MVDQMLTQVIVNGTEVSPDGTNRLRKYIIDDTFGVAVSEAIVECTIGIFDDIPTLASGMSVIIKRGFTTKADQFIFEGNIDNISKEGSIVVLYCKDKLNDLVKSTVTYSYDGDNFPSTESKVSDSAKVLIEQYEGLTADVVDT